MEMDTIAPAGPRTIAAIVTPTACPVVPPGKGRLNIITTNENAANMAINGIVRVARSLFVRLIAEYHPALASAYMVTQVDGLR